MNSPVNAPYNFVPLSERVVDDWDEPAPNGVPSHDIPYSDGICGEVTFEIVAESPLLVAGPDNSDQVKRFFRGPDGNPAIPGSAIRGMIRNVVEIASFSRFKFVEDRRLGLRDLTGAAREEYTKRLTETENGAYRSRARAGWLSLNADGTWKITPCSFARVEHSDVQAVLGFGGDFHSKIRKETYPLDCRAAYSLYNTLELVTSAWVDQQETHYEHSGGKWLAYKKAHPSEQAHTKKQSGQVVFTGAPNKRKHLEFFFFDPEAAPVEVPPDVVAGFLSVHEEQEKPSENWKFWCDHFYANRVSSIPVFYICDDNNQIDAMGLSMMFKMAQRNSIMDLVRKNLDAHIDEESTAPPDLSERLFGRVSSKPEQSFKGRVQFGLAVLATKSSWQEVRAIKTAEGATQILDTVLGAPKPSWFPAYLEQGKLDADGRRLSGRDAKERSGKYRTYMDDDARLRGWKRYPIRPATKDSFLPPLPPSGISDDAKVKLSALLPREKRMPVTFRGTLRFHNLRSFELGALLWAVTWGGDTAARHRLGMGKPFGWGQVRMHCRDAKLRYNRPEESGQRPTYKGEEALQAVLGTQKRFEEKMEEFVTDWSNSRQIQALCAMARLQRNPPHDLRHPKLDVDGRKNEFTDLKKAGAVLPYWGIDPPNTPDLRRGSSRDGAPRGGRPPQGGGRNSASRGSGSPASRRPATPLVFAAGTRVTDGEWEVTVIDDVPVGAIEMMVRDENNDTEPVDVASYREIGE